MTITEQALKDAFKACGNYAYKDSEALKECLNVSKEFGITAKELADDYDLYLSVKDIHTSEVLVTILQSKAFRDVLVKQHGKSRPPLVSSGNKLPFASLGSSWENVSEKDSFQYQPTPKRQATDAHNIRTGGISSASKPGLALTPTMDNNRTPSRAPAATTPSMLTPPGTTTKFALRGNKGQAVSTLNEHVPAVQGTAAGRAAPLPLQLLGEPLPRTGHLYQAATLDTMVAAIDERIMDFADALKRTLPDEAADVDRQQAGEVTQEPVWVAGRIVSDAEGGAAGAALNEQSVLLEGCREASEGARVRLDLRQLPAYRLFPGQVVCVKGLNPSGSAFVAQQLCTHLPAPAHAAGAAAAGSSQAAGPLSVVVAAGPFTTADDMAFEPLQDLLRYCADKQPDLVVLLGPFIDTEHPAVRDCTLDVTFETAFREQVVQRLSLWQQRNPGCRVALAPAIRDAHAAPTFPQPPLSATASAPLPDSIMPLQNPAVFAVEGLAVGAVTSDVIKALSGAELARAPTGQQQDRLAALASHVVGQRSFFPLHPPPLGSCLDLSHASQLALPCTPDLLLLPSDLAAFAKLVPLAAAADGQQQLPGLVRVPGAPEAVVCVNPGRLARGSGGGTFAHVMVAGGSGPVHARCRVELRRI